MQAQHTHKRAYSLNVDYTDGIVGRWVDKRKKQQKQMNKWMNEKRLKGHRDTKRAEPLSTDVIAVACGCGEKSVNRCRSSVANISYKFCCCILITV